MRRSRAEIDRDAVVWLDRWLAGESGPQIAATVTVSLATVNRGLRRGARLRYGETWRDHPDFLLVRVGRYGHLGIRYEP